VTEAHQSPPATVAAAPLRLVALGTSLTARGGWLEPLRQHLERALARPVDAVNFGKSGAASGGGLRVLAEACALTPDIALIEFSANDAALHRGIPLAASCKNARRMIAALRAANPRVALYLMTMNPVFGPRGWLRPRLAGYYAAYRDLARDEATRLLDLEPAWRALPPATLRQAIPDGAHPLPAAFERVALPLMREALLRDLAG
jgi:lysophospholipase L1-like esterase